MTLPFAGLPRLPRIAAGFVLLLAAGPAILPVSAQGTDEQREACAPDAVKLCQDTIPDIPKTTACMKAHFAELSPRCKVAFKAVTGGSTAARPADVAGREEAPPPAAAEIAPEPERVPGLRSYEAHIRKICHEGLIDPFTCRSTLDALKASE